MASMEIIASIQMSKDSVRRHERRTAKRLKREKNRQKELNIRRENKARYDAKMRRDNEIRTQLDEQAQELDEILESISDPE